MEYLFSHQSWHRLKGRALAFTAFTGLSFSLSTEDGFVWELPQLPFHSLYSFSNSSVQPFLLHFRSWRQCMLGVIISLGQEISPGWKDTWARGRWAQSEWLKSERGPEFSVSVFTYWVLSWKMRVRLVRVLFAIGFSLYPVLNNSVSPKNLPTHFEIHKLCRMEHPVGAVRCCLHQESDNCFGVFWISHCTRIIL